MKTKLLFILLFLFLGNFLYPQCPTYFDILNHGYSAYNPIYAYPYSYSLYNLDEFGITDPSSFVVKVDQDIPHRAFPKTNDCSYFYMAFDTDGQNTPINYDVTWSEWHTVTTYREDGTGHQFKVYPPSYDFVAKFDGSFHDQALTGGIYPWDEWQNFVQYIGPVNVNFDVELIGSSYAPSNSQPTFLANITGGSGNYIIEWKYRIKYTTGYGAWIDVPVAEQEIWPFNNYTYSVYVYDNQHKITITMPKYPIEVNLFVEDYESGLSKEIFKYVTNKKPRPSIEKISSNIDKSIDNEYDITNYPNPFNPITMIKYDLAEDSKVQIKVYDVLGNEVAELVNDEKPAGRYEVEFNASSLVSGVYLYRIQAGSFVDTKKMILMK